MKNYIKLSILVFAITFATFGTNFKSNAVKEKIGCRCYGLGICGYTDSGQVVQGKYTCGDD